MTCEQSTLKDLLIRAMFRVKGLTAKLHSTGSAKMAGCGISMAEFQLMSLVRYNSLNSGSNASVAEIQNILYTTKGAVSKMLGALEGKGYINRDVNKQNRRELVITLTENGLSVLSDLESEADKMLSSIIDKLGQDRTAQIIEGINQLSDAISEVVGKE
jgi:DNA-binding MarR family transcriptional regulator